MLALLPALLILAVLGFAIAWFMRSNPSKLARMARIVSHLGCFVRAEHAQLRREVRNIGASVRARLLDRARVERSGFQIVLTRYALERLLYRLSVSAHRAALHGSPEDRISGKITDSAFSVPNNKYVLAMAGVNEIAIRAKPVLRDGEIERLFISDTA